MWRNTSFICVPIECLQSYATLFSQIIPTGLWRRKITSFLFGRGLCGGIISLYWYTGSIYASLMNAGDLWTCGWRHYQQEKIMFIYILCLFTLVTVWMSILDNLVNLCACTFCSNTRRSFTKPSKPVTCVRSCLCYARICCPLLFDSLSSSQIINSPRHPRLIW